MRSIATVVALAGATLAISRAERFADPLFDAEFDFYRKDKRGKGQNNRRGKGKRSPPKQRPNRLTISKRVRRKHRRAAK